MKRLLFTFFFLSGVFIFLHAQTGKLYSTDNELSNSLINTIFQDSRNYIWIATEDGLNKYDGVKFSIYRNDKLNTHSLKNNYVRSLFEDSRYAAIRIACPQPTLLAMHCMEPSFFRSIRLAGLLVW